MDLKLFSNSSVDLLTKSVKLFFILLILLVLSFDISNVSAKQISRDMSQFNTRKTSYNLQPRPDFDAWKKLHLAALNRLELENRDEGIKHIVDSPLKSKSGRKLLSRLLRRKRTIDSSANTSENIVNGTETNMETSTTEPAINSIANQVINSSTSYNLSHVSFSHMDGHAPTDSKHTDKNICQWNSHFIKLENQEPSVLKVIQCTRETIIDSEGRTVRCVPAYYTISLKQTVKDHEGNIAEVKDIYRRIPVACLPEIQNKNHHDRRNTDQDPAATTSSIPENTKESGKLDDCLDGCPSNNKGTESLQESETVSASAIGGGETSTTVSAVNEKKPKLVDCLEGC